MPSKPPSLEEAAKDAANFLMGYSPADDHSFNEDEEWFKDLVARMKHHGRRLRAGLRVNAAGEKDD